MYSICDNELLSTVLYIYDIVYIFIGFINKSRN
jgi:hypothetical protein